MRQPPPLPRLCAVYPDVQSRKRGARCRADSVQHSGWFRPAICRRNGQDNAASRCRPIIGHPQSRVCRLNLLGEVDWNDQLQLVDYTVLFCPHYTNTRPCVACTREPRDALPVAGHSSSAADGSILLFRRRGLVAIEQQQPVLLQADGVRHKPPQIRCGRASPSSRSTQRRPGLAVGGQPGGSRGGVRGDAAAPVCAQQLRP